MQKSLALNDSNKKRVLNESHIKNYRVLIWSYYLTLYWRGIKLLKKLNASWNFNPSSYHLMQTLKLRSTHLKVLFSTTMPNHSTPFYTLHNVSLNIFLSHEIWNVADFYFHYSVQPWASPMTCIHLPLELCNYISQGLIWQATSWSKLLNETSI